MNMKQNTISTRTPSTYIISNSLKFLSWNIQAPSTVEGNKFVIDDFKSILLGHDFICLQEIRKNISLPGYRPECNIRTGSETGGVGILVKNDYIGGG